MVLEDLRCEKKDGIATVTLNNPDKMNPFTLQMRRSIVNVAAMLDADDEARVIIVTGAGRAFSAGGDVETMKARLAGTLKQSRHERLQRAGFWADAFMKIDKPVIAAINGTCLGAGLSLALSCDIRIASETAKFGAAFVARGLIPDCALTYLLPREVGTSKALELMFSGEQFDAAEAERLGIVSRVVPQDEVMSCAHRLAMAIMERPPIAVELTKRLVYRGILEDVARHIEWETYGQRLCQRTEDHRQSVAAFMEKRPPPPYQGK